MQKTVYEERRLFYHDIVFICYTEALPYLKILNELGDMAVMHSMIPKYQTEHDSSYSPCCFVNTSMGTEDRICQIQTHALTYNVRLEYFHLWGRIRVASHQCFHCGLRRQVEILKYDRSVDDVICSVCANPEYYKNL